MDYLDDPDLTWSAVGLLTYLLSNRIHTLVDFDRLLLDRAVGVWHPRDRGDHEDAWSVLVATGYIVETPSGWRVRKEA